MLLDSKPKMKLNLLNKGEYYEDKIRNTKQN